VRTHRDDFGKDDSESRLSTSLDEAAKTTDAYEVPLGRVPTHELKEGERGRGVIL